MIYLGIEFASMASYLAVAFLKKDVKGSEAGPKYVIYGSVASGIMLATETMDSVRAIPRVAVRCMLTSPP